MGRMRQACEHPNDDNVSIPTPIDSGKERKRSRRGKGVQEEKGGGRERGERREKGRDKGCGREW